MFIRGTWSPEHQVKLVHTPLPSPSPSVNCMCKNVCTHHVSNFTFLSAAFRAPLLCKRRATCPRYTHPRTPQPSDEIDLQPLSTPTHCGPTNRTKTKPKQVPYEPRTAPKGSEMTETPFHPSSLRLFMTEIVPLLLVLHM